MTGRPRRALVALAVLTAVTSCSGDLAEGPFGVAEQSTLQFTPDSYPVVLTWGVELPYDLDGSDDAVIRDLTFDADGIDVTSFGLQEVQPGENVVGLQLGEYGDRLESPLGQPLRGGPPELDQLVFVLEVSGPGAIDGLMIEYTIGEEQYRCPLKQALVIGDSQA